MGKSLISVLAGLGGMFGWGVSDFFANQSSDKVGHFRTFFWSQVAGVSLFAIILVIVKPSFAFSPILIPLLVVAAAGYSVGYLLFYKAFEIGNVSVVSAVINLNTILAMFVAIVVFKQRLTPPQIIGVLMVLAGIIFVGVNFKDLFGKKSLLTKGVKETVLASIAFGIFYWPVNEYITERAHWLTTSTFIKMLSLLIVFFIALSQKNKLRIKDKSKNIIFIIVIVGVLEAIGVLSTSFGVSVGDSVLVAPISSSLSIVTISLAIIFLKEKVTNFQKIGILLTITGIILTAF